MAIYRTPKTSNFSCMSNTHFRDRTLSLKAKGLLSLMLSLPDDWHFSIGGLTVLSSDGRASTLSAIKELKQAGYLNIHAKKSSDGLFAGNEFDIFESPISTNPESDNPPPDNPSADKPSTSDPPMDNPPLENPQQINTNLPNTNLPNTNLPNTNLPNIYIANTNTPNNHTASSHATRSPPTIAAINDYCKLHNFVIDVRSFYNYYSARNWRDKNGTPVDWQKKIIRWASQTPDTPQGH